MLICKIIFKKISQSLHWKEEEEVQNEQNLSKNLNLRIIGYFIYKKLNLLISYIQIIIKYHTKKLQD
jgi:hypothetical protein